jgi:uncharacterized protein (TIRG00374 family)
VNQPSRSGVGRQPRRFGRLLTILLSLGIGLLILGLWVYVVGPGEIVDSLRTVSPVPALLATLAWLLAMGLRGFKWHAILASTQPMPLATTGRVFWASAFLNMVFPFRVGELARSLFLKRLVGAPIAATLPSVLVDRLYTMAVILFGLLFLPLTSFGLHTPGEGASPDGPGMGSLRWGLGFLAGGFLAALIGIFVLRNQKMRLLGLAERLTPFLPQRLQARVVGFLDTLIDGMRVIRSDPWSVLGLLAWSTAVLWADAVKDHFVFRAFNLNIPVTTCYLAVSLTTMAFILPSPPGNIGSNEWYATLVYASGFGLNATSVAGGALFGHAMTALVVAVGGALSLSTLGLNLAEGLRIAQTAEPSPAAAPGEGP